MISGDLVLAIGHDEQHRQVDDATAEHRERLDRRLVCPMRVLDDDQCRTGSLEVLDEAAHEAITVVARGNVEFCRDLEERAERAWSDQRVAAPEADPATSADTSRERGDERRLADARLASDEHHSTVTRLRVPEPLAQQAELVVALEQLHHCQLRPSCRCSPSRV